MKRIRIAVNTIAAVMLLLMACHKEPAMMPAVHGGNTKQTDGLGIYFIWEWLQAASPNSTYGRQYAFGFNIGTKGYVGGGGTNNYGTELSVQDLWEYDPTTNAWTQKSSIPVAVEQAASFVCGTQGYVCGGIHYGQNGNDYFVNNLFQYDQASNSWKILSDFPGVARVGATGINIGNAGFVGLGSSIHYTYLNDWWRYDPVADHWTQEAPFPGTPRGYASGFSVGNQGFVTCGVGLNFTLNDLWAYSGLTGEWSREADLPSVSRMAAAGFNYGSYGALVGGDYVPVPFMDSLLNDFWYYNPPKNLWSKGIPCAGVPRLGAVGFTINDVPYVGTGYNQNQGGYLDDFWYETLVFF